MDPRKNSSLTRLPFDDAWADIEKILKTHKNLVLVAEPGAGKTTRFPAMLIEAGLISPGGKVAVLEPRRLAARAAATRISMEREWPMKTKVGYSVRFDHQITSSTRLAFYTEGLFLRKLSNDADLKDIECVVIDEFHERSRFTDIGIAVLKELQLLERPDLRIVVMSATIDAEKISAFLSLDEKPAPIVRVPGRTYPIEVRHSKEPLSLLTGREWTDRMTLKIKNIVTNPLERKGDTLVFFPGTGEIRRVRENLEQDVVIKKDFDVFELHGSLSLSEQAKVLTPAQSKPRIILATNIAETSLTIDGVGTVIDSGLARVARADRLGFSQLHLERISLASAKQRSGRAGRQFEGISHRLWSKLDENSFQDFDEAEIQRIDLADALLEIYNLGVTDPRQFDWFERPDTERLQTSLKLLQQLGAVDEGFRLTDTGREMHKTSLPTRAAKMFVAAARGDIKSAPRDVAHTLAAILAGLLTEKDILSNRSAQNSFHECDLFERATHITQNHRQGVDGVALATLRKVISGLIENQANLGNVIENWNEKAVAEILFQGFPDRVARRRNPKDREQNRTAQARMVGGRGVELHPASLVRQSEFFFALRGDAGKSKTSNDPLATLASGLEKEWIEEFGKNQCKENRKLIFDDDALAAFEERRFSYLDLPLREGHREKPKPDDVFDLLIKETVKRRARLFETAAIARLNRRLSFLVLKTSNTRTAITKDDLEASLLRAIEEKVFGKTSIEFFLTESGSEDLAQSWEQNLSQVHRDAAKALQDVAPSHFQAPTQNRFRIEYPENQSPFVEVKLQELFGIKTHPMIAGVPLAFHLLGPNYRPVQVTADLPGFWRGSYFEVRKELRARYPKHSWPENPLEAAPEVKGHRRPKQ